MINIAFETLTKASFAKHLNIENVQILALRNQKLIYDRCR